MSESNNNVVTPVSRRSAASTIVSVASELDKADIVAIAAVKFEEQLEAAKGRLARRIAEVNMQIADADAALRKTCEQIVQEHDISPEQAAVKALKDAGFGIYEVASSLEEIDENKQQVMMRVSINPKTAATRSYYSQSLEKHTTAPFSAQARQLLKALRADRQAAGELNKHLAEIHKKLSGIPALERKARAKLAENALDSSPEGKRILEQLMSLSDQSLPQFLLTDGR